MSALSWALPAADELRVWAVIIACMLSQRRECLCAAGYAGAGLARAACAWTPSQWQLRQTEVFRLALSLSNGCKHAQADMCVLPESCKLDHTTVRLGAVWRMCSCRSSCHCRTCGQTTTMKEHPENTHDTSDIVHVRGQPLAAVVLQRYLSVPRHCMSRDWSTVTQQPMSRRCSRAVQVSAAGSTTGLLLVLWQLFAMIAPA